MRELFAKQDDPYADADREAARRWGGLLFLVQSGLIVALSPLTPPTERFGEAGWAVLAGVVVVQLALALLLLRRGERVGDNVLLSFNYLAVAAIALLSWLTGEIDPAFMPILVLWVVFTPSSHPPRRVAPFLLFVGAAVAAPLVDEGWSRSEAGELASWLAVMLALAAVVMVRVRSFRQLRIGLARSGEEAMQLAVTDALTGLANRRAFAEVVEREANRAEVEGTPLTLVLADLDGFKQLNDNHGHVKGDQYLRRVADTMKSMLREQDLGFRWGGDEFALLLRDTDRKAAHGVCERIGGVVRAALYETAGVPMSISFGLAEYGPGMSAEELVAEADMDLMEEKEQERIG
ncbi:MAG: GGDEF domain-containing protein [Solirubrobacterales bacterium]